ncbi:MAG: VWA domain-containing protein, partial [Spirochaetes bacterium]|nr:VWA domain-containing protein [Spirochaetota bacterium]
MVDTSLTMIGRGEGHNILPQVKQSLPKFINELEEDDSITFMTFETNVNPYPTIYINDDNDKDIINKYISTIEAKGKWTYTSLMLKTVMEKAQELEDKGPDRQRIIVIMTDTLDDPPPGMRGDRLKINTVEGTKKYSEKDWFILLMNFGEAKKNKNLAKQLAGISKYSKIIDATAGGITKKELVQNAIENGIKQNIEELAAKKDEDNYPVNTILIAVIIIIILLAALFYIKRMSELKV